MQRSHLALLAASLLTFSVAISASSALAATPDFTISATNAAMSSSGITGSGSTTFTLTSVNDYTGTVKVNCVAPNPPAGENLPTCGESQIWVPYTLSANQVVTGKISLYNFPGPKSVSLPSRKGQRLSSGLALAGLFLFGFGIRRRPARWLTMTLLAAGALGGLAGISACGANNSVVTPGTYAYTITAMDMNTNVRVITSVNVMVP